MATGPRNDATPRSAQVRLLVYLCFFVSGASALVYEIAWMRQLLLVLGTTTAAVSTVLAVFMTGLALGAYLFGRAADRLTRPLRTYAYLEAGIALYALLLPQLLSGCDPLYVGLARAAAGQPLVVTIIRTAFGFTTLLLPTILMGATLPLLLRFASTSERRFGQDLGTLYAANLAGAMVGCIAAGFVLVPTLGIQGASVAAATGNLAAALIAVLLSRSESAPVSQGLTPPKTTASSGAPSPVGGGRAALWAVILVSGLVSMGYEVLWTRILIFQFYSTVHSFTIILATVVGSLALGSGLFAALGARRHTPRLLAAALIAAGLSALLLAPLSARFPQIVGGLSTRFGYTGSVYLGATALSAAMLILLPATLMGIVFPLSCRLLVTDLRRMGTGIGGAYLVNTVGCVLGSIGTGSLLIPMLSLKGSLAFLSGLQVLAGCAVIHWSGWSSPNRRFLMAGSTVVFGGSLLLVFGLLQGPNPFDARLQGAQAQGAVLEAHRDEAASSVSVVTSTNGDRTLRIDGFQTALDNVYASYMGMMTHIPMLVHPGAERLLVICFGTGTTAGAGLIYPGTRIDVVDINRSVFDFAPFFRHVNRGVWQDQRARLIVDDGRNFLLTTRESYDIITLEPMPPTFSGMVNLYSREYYALAREHLRPGGLVVQWLPFHLLTVSESWAILRTMQEVLPYATLWIKAGTGIIVAGADGPLTVDVARLRQRLESEELRQELRRLGTPSIEDFIGQYALGPESLRLLTAQAGRITDDHPTLEFHAPRHANMATLGTYGVEQAQCLEAICRAGRSEPLPLTSAEAAFAGHLSRMMAASAHAGLADLYQVFGNAEKAEAEKREGLALADTPALRARFLFERARLAFLGAKSRWPESRRLTEESLAVVHDQPDALWLRQALATAR